MNIKYKAKQRIYLASPYSHEDPQVREYRFRAVTVATAYLMAQGNVVYSPIVHSHVVAEFLDNALDHEFWLTQDASHIATNDKMTIYKLEGWKKSFGVTWETGFVNGLGIPVDFLETDVVCIWAEERGIII